MVTASLTANASTSASACASASASASACACACAVAHSRPFGALVGPQSSIARGAVSWLRISQP